MHIFIGSTEKPQYFGGEIRRDCGGKRAYVNIAAEGAGWAANNTKDAVAAV